MRMTDPPDDQDPSTGNGYHVYSSNSPIVRERPHDATEEMITTMTPATATEAAPLTKAKATTRLRNLSKTINDADQQIKVLRRHRNWGAAMLSQYHGVQPIVIYKDILGGVSRNLFVRITRSVTAEPPKDFPVDYTDVEALTEYTAKVAREFNHYTEIRAAARAKRDPLIISVVNGLEDVKMSNAEVSRATGLTTGRISHLVKGRKRYRYDRKVRRH